MWLELHSMIDSLSQAFQNYPKNDSWTRSLLYYKYPASPVSVSKFQVEDLDNGLGHWERIVKEDSRILSPSMCGENPGQSEKRATPEVYFC